MRPHRRVGLPLLFVALGTGWVPALGGDSAAEAALKAKGLARAGRVFLDVEAERPVLAKFKEVRAVYADYAAVAEKQAAVEQIPMQSALLEQQRVAMKANLDALDRQIRSQSSGRSGRMARSMGPTPLQVEHQQVQGAMNEVASTQKAVKAQTPSAKDKAALDDEAKKKGEAFKAALAELRPMVDEVKAKYADLGADESVKKSLAELEKAGHAKMSLGPSEAFAAAAKELDQAERRFLGKKPTDTAKAATAKKKDKSKK